MNKVVAANISGLWNPTMDPIKAWDWPPISCFVYFGPGKAALCQVMFRLSLGVSSGQGQFPSRFHPILEGERVKNKVNFALCSSTCWLKHNYCDELCVSQNHNLAEVEDKPSLCTQVQMSVLPNGHLGSSQKTFLKHIPVGMQQISAYQKHCEKRLH